MDLILCGAGRQGRYSSVGSLTSSTSSGIHEVSKNTKGRQRAIELSRSYSEILPGNQTLTERHINVFVDHNLADEMT
jgi:hypothetical protein